MAFAVMLAKSYDPKRIKDWKNTTIEPKLDGVRVAVTIDHTDKVRYFSRNGRELDMFTHLNKSVRKLADRLAELDPQFRHGAMLDGEMVADSAKFGDISGAIHRKNHTADYARFHCFHVMPLHLFEAGADKVPQLQRMTQLARCIDSARDLIRHSQPVYVESDKDVQVEYAKFRERSLEGAMVKVVSEPWIGKRSFAWLKMKPEETTDVIVSSLKKGTGKYSKTLGALICHRVLKGGKLGAQVQVSGMTDEQRALWWTMPKRIVGKMIEVAYHEATEIGKLRHPRFVRVRHDKQGESSK